jgi:hypothetical protein
VVRQVLAPERDEVRGVRRNSLIYGGHIMLVFWASGDEKCIYPVWKEDEPGGRNIVRMKGGRE